MSPKKPAPPTISDIKPYCNAAYMKVVEDARVLVLKKYPALCPSKSCLDLTSMLASYAKDEKFQCVGFISWFSMDSPTPNMPLMLSKMHALKKHFYCQSRASKEISQVLVAAVDKDIAKAELETMLNQGRLPVALPVEMIHAWWVGFADAINEKQKNMDAWVRAGKEQPIQFKHLVGTAAEWDAMQHREDAAEASANLRCTPLMRIIHIGNVKVSILHSCLVFACIFEFQLNPQTMSFGRHCYV